MIDTVARLRDLEADATPGRWFYRRDDSMASDVGWIVADDNWRESLPASGLYRRDAALITEMRNALPKLLELTGYLAHSSWRCRQYKACECGLDELTDSLGMERVPYDECAG